LKSQEDAYNDQIQTLEQKSNDSNGSQMSRSKASTELAQLKQTDPLPLRKAKITQQAADRKVDQQVKAAEKATAIATQKAESLAELTRILEAKKETVARQKASVEITKKQVEEAVSQTEENYRQAESYLEQVKNSSGTAYGSIWFMERELEEAKKYLPKRKQ